MNCVSKRLVLCLCLLLACIYVTGRSSPGGGGGGGLGGGGGDKQFRGNLTPPQQQYHQQQQNQQQQQQYHHHQQQGYDDGYGYATYNNEEMGGQAQEGKGEEATAGSTTSDIVPLYTKNVLSKLLVSLSSALCSMILFYLSSKLVFSRASNLLTLVFAALCAVSSFVPGGMGDFSRALGVFFIIFTRRAKPFDFASRSFKQFGSALMLAARRPFPPCENPWKYGEPPDASGVVFSMINTLIGIVFTTAMAGWTISGFIPFFPTWLGALGAAIICGYVGTLRDAKGDMLRYFGYSVNVLFSDLSMIADDVLLKEKANVVMGTTYAFLNRLDKKHQVLAKLKTALATIAAKTSFLLNRVKSDMQESQGGEESNSSGDQRQRKDV